MPRRTVPISVSFGAQWACSPPPIDAFTRPPRQEHWSGVNASPSVATVHRVGPAGAPGVGPAPDAGAGRVSRWQPRAQPKLQPSAKRTTTSGDRIMVLTP